MSATASLQVGITPCPAPSCRPIPCRRLVSAVSFAGYPLHIALRAATRPFWPCLPFTCADCSNVSHDQLPCPPLFPNCVPQSLAARKIFRTSRQNTQICSSTQCATAPPARNVGPPYHLRPSPCTFFRPTHPLTSTPSSTPPFSPSQDLPTWVDIEMTTEEKLAVIAAETETVHFSIAIRKWIFRRLENEGFEESKLAAHYQGEIDKVDRRLAHAEDQLRESFELEQLVLAKAVEIEMQLEDQRDKCRRLLATRNGTAAQSREELEAVQRLVAELGTRKSP